MDISLNTPFKVYMETSRLISINEYIPKEEVIYDQEYYINEYIEKIEFFSKLFDYNMNDIINNLNEQKDEDLEFAFSNIGYLKDKEGNLKTFPNFEYGLIEYFYHLNKTNSLPRKQKHLPYNGDGEYIENLIIYFSSIYENVNPIDLLSIGAAESGYYKVKFMLNANNIYGGLYNGRLIKHNNIELGVLSYVRLMNRHYYGKGFNTIESIGRKYCPVVNSTGAAVANPHWLNLVKQARKKYIDYEDTITFSQLIERKEEI